MVSGGLCTREGLGTADGGREGRSHGQVHSSWVLCQLDHIFAGATRQVTAVHALCSVSSSCIDTNDMYQRMQQFAAAERIDRSLGPVLSPSAQVDQTCNGRHCLKSTTGPLPRPLGDQVWRTKAQAPPNEFIQPGGPPSNLQRFLVEMVLLIFFEPPAFFLLLLTIFFLLLTILFCVVVCIEPWVSN